MIICIVTKNLTNFFTQSDSLDVVNISIKSGIPVDCWWYTGYGKRYQESVIFFDEDDIIQIRTESDASPLEEM